MVEGAPKLIILDTNALIAFLGDKDSTEYYNILAFLKKNNQETLALTTPSLAEFFAGDENQLRSHFLLQKDSKFKNLDFDLKSALIASEIYKQYRKLPVMKNAQIPHQKVKVDIQILAIALANEANAIITRDKGILTLIKRLELDIKVCDFQDISGENNLKSNKLIVEELVIQ